MSIQSRIGRTNGARNPYVGNAWTPILAPPSILGRVRRGKRAPVVGVWLVWVGLVWRFSPGSLVAGAGAAVSLVLGVLVAVRHDYSG